MKIDKIETWLMQVGSDGRRANAKNISKENIGVSRRNWLFIKIYTDEGITGVGECSGWPAVVQTILQEVEQILIGEDPLNISALAEKVFHATHGHGILGTPLGGAMAGLDMALWDIAGKALNVPVWKLLGGKLRDRVPAYAHADHPERGRDLAARGFKLLKANSKNGRLDIPRLFELRAAIGDDVDLCVDAKGPPWMSFADAVEVAKALEPLRLVFYEEPLPPEAALDYGPLRARVNIPIATGERLATLADFRNLLQTGGVDVVQPDSGRTGGITQMRKIAALAEAFGASVAPHSGSLGPIGEFAAVHLMATIPNCLAIEHVADDWPGRYEVVTAACEVVDGAFTLPEGPGLGVDLVESEIRKYPQSLSIDVPTTLDMRATARGRSRFGWQSALSAKASYLNRSPKSGEEE